MLLIIALPQEHVTNSVTASDDRRSKDLLWPIGGRKSNSQCPHSFNKIVLVVYQVRDNAHLVFQKITTKIFLYLTFVLNQTNLFFFALLRTSSSFTPICSLFLISEIALYSLLLRTLEISKDHVTENKQSV